MRGVRLLLCLMLGWLVVSHAPPAFADDKADARAHFDSGLALLRGDSKDYAGALVEFQASVRLYPTKSGLYNLGQCYRRLSRYAEALATFAELEDQFGAELDADLRADVAREVKAIRRLSAELTVLVSQPGATIRLGGAVVGKSPLPEPLVLPPREHYLEVELGGFEPVQRTLSLATGQRHTETISLKPLAAKLMVTTGNVRGAAIVVDGREIGTSPMLSPLSLPAGDHTVRVEKEGFEPVAEQRVFLLGGDATALAFQLRRPPPEPPQRGKGGKDTGMSTQRTLAWIGAGLTGTAALFAGVFWVQADQRYGDFSSYDDQIASGAVRQGDPRAADVVDARQSAADDTDRYSAAAIGFGIGAGVLAATTVVLFAFDLSPADAPDSGIYTRPDGLGVRF